MVKDMAEEMENMMADKIEAIKVMLSQQHSPFSKLQVKKKPTLT